MRHRVKRGSQRAVSGAVRDRRGRPSGCGREVHRCAALSEPEQVFFVCVFIFFSSLAKKPEHINLSRSAPMASILGGSSGGGAGSGQIRCKFKRRRRRRSKRKGKVDFLHHTHFFFNCSPKAIGVIHSEQEVNKTSPFTFTLVFIYLSTRLLIKQFTYIVYVPKCVMCVPVCVRACALCRCDGVLRAAHMSFCLFAF